MYEARERERDCVAYVWVGVFGVFVCKHATSKEAISLKVFLQKVSFLYSTEKNVFDKRNDQKNNIIIIIYFLLYSFFGQNVVINMKLCYKTDNGRNQRSHGRKYLVSLCVVKKYSCNLQKNDYAMNKLSW